MSIRTGFLKLATFAAIAAVGLAPATAQAQNRGQLVQAVAKLNQAQMAFAKKLADDPQFAAQFDQAASSGNYDAAAALAASVTGLAKSNIKLSAGGAHDNHDAASTAPTQTSVYQLASFKRPVERKEFSLKICFDVGVAWGCIGW